MESFTASSQAASQDGLNDLTARPPEFRSCGKNDRTICSSVARAIGLITSEMRTGFGVLLMLIATQLWGAAMFQHNLSIDDEFAAFRTNATIWLKEGRLVSYWMEALMRQTSLFVLPYMMLVFSQVFAFFAVLRLLDSRPRSWMHVAVFTAYASSPVTWELMQFNTNVPGYSIGLVLVSVALLLHGQLVDEGVSSRGGLLAGGALVGLLALALLVYQSLITVYLVVAVGLLLRECIYDASAHRIRRGVGLIILATVLSIAVYWLLGRLALLAGGLSGFTYLDSYRFQGSGSELLRSVLDEMVRFYSGSPSVYGLRLLSLPLLTVSFVVLIVVIGWNHSGDKSWLPVQRFQKRRLGLILLLLMSPFLVCLKTGPLPVRTYLALPFVLLVLSLIFDILLSRTQRFRLVGILLTAAVAFQSVAAVSEYYAAAGFAQDRDRTIAVDMISRIRSNPNYDPAKTYYLMTHGFIPGLKSLSPYRVSRDAVASASFFDWDNGNPKRIASYLRLNGLPIAVALRDRRAAAERQMKALRPWPSSESIRIEDDLILIKLGA